MEDVTGATASEQALLSFKLISPALKTDQSSRGPPDQG